MKALSLFPELEVIEKKMHPTTFQDNMKLPIHRWYRYTAGFSGAWVGQLIEQEKDNGRYRVIDPFAGSGTVMVEAMQHGMDSYGIESNPYVNRIANAKLMWKYMAPMEWYNSLIDVLRIASKLEVKRTEYPSLILRCFTPDNLRELESLREAYLTLSDDKVRCMAWFVITSILRPCSYAHKLGEFIGKFFESTMKQPVKDIAKKYDMYFDSYGYRKARGKDKVT